MPVRSASRTWSENTTARRGTIVRSRILSAREKRDIPDAAYQSAARLAVWVTAGGPRLARAVSPGHAPG